MHKLDKLAYEMDYEGRSSSRGFVLAGIVAIAMIIGIVAFCCSGCGTIRSIAENQTLQDMAIEQLDRLADKWIAKLEKLPPVAKPPVVVPEPGKPVPPVVAAGDAIPFSSLEWKYGGFTAKNAVFDRVTLSSLTCDGNNVRYKFDVGLDAWGLGHTEAGAICAVFIERPSGFWEGGKFDWVSTSRTSRELKHLKDYNEWNESLPVRGRIAFGVFSADGKRRSNILVAGAN